MKNDSLQQLTSKIKISRRDINKYINVLILIFLLAQVAFSQQKSLMLKNQTAEYSSFIVQRNMLDEQLWDSFLLVKKANSGDPVAQHVLGLRYLLGQDFSADTVKAAYWINKAAEKNVFSAQYNYGILLNNGWGVGWNPFEAFRNFKKAAMQGLTDAEYVYGLFHTDNLVVPRNYSEAYHWIKIAADSGYSPAKEILNEFEKRGIIARIKTQSIESKSATVQGSMIATPTNSQPTIHPIFIDFTPDSLPSSDNETLFKEAMAYGGEQTKNIIDSSTFYYSESLFNFKTIQAIEDAGKAGSPEALTMLGRMYEQGVGLKADSVAAGFYYLQAMRFDSPHAPKLLWDIIQKPGYFSRLKEQIDAGDPLAEVVWAGLVEFGFDHQLTEVQAFTLLENGAKKNFPAAITQLSICYYSGRWVKQDKLIAINLLQRAERLGNRDAQIRLYAIELKDNQDADKMDEYFNLLQQAAGDGSVLAETIIGYAYENGRGVRQNKPEAIKYYRKATNRGSQIAYNALVRLYDEIRPKDLEFQIQE